MTQLKISSFLTVFYLFVGSCFAQSIENDIVDGTVLFFGVIVLFIGSFALCLCGACFFYRARQQNNALQVVNIMEPSPTAKLIIDAKKSSAPTQSIATSASHSSDFARSSSAAPPPNTSRPLSSGAHSVKSRPPSSYGRLDSAAQERVRSVRLQAEKSALQPFQPFLPDKERFSERLNNSKVKRSPAAAPASSSFEEQVQRTSSQPRSKAEIRSKIIRMAEGASAGGIYNTGGSTARLSARIMEGVSDFKERASERMSERKATEKKEQEAKTRLQRSQQQRMRQVDTPKVPVVSPPTSQKTKKQTQGHRQIWTKSQSGTPHALLKKWRRGDYAR